MKKLLIGLLTLVSFSSYADYDHHLTCYWSDGEVLASMDYSSDFKEAYIYSRYVSGEMTKSYTTSNDEIVFLLENGHAINSSDGYKEISLKFNKNKLSHSSAGDILLSRVSQSANGSSFSRGRIKCVVDN